MRHSTVDDARRPSYEFDVDPYILLWDFHQDDLKEPSARFLGHRVREHHPRVPHAIHSLIRPTFLLSHSHRPTNTSTRGVYS